MANIALPFTTRFLKHIEWTLDRPAQVNRSAYSRKRQVIAYPWSGMWTAKADLLPIIGEQNVLAWRAFLASLRGQINTFRLPMTEGGQAGLATGVQADGAALAGATTMVIKGSGGTAVSGLLGGHFVTVNDQPLLLTTAAVPNVPTSTTLITFEPALRANVATNTATEIANPTCLVALATSTVGWTADPGKIYGISLQVEEAF